MNDYVYRLNLPNIERVVLSLDKIKNLVPDNFQGSQIFYPNPRDIFQPEWLTYKNLEWDYVSLFIRSSREISMLHKDNPHNPESLHWGINWILGDNSIMEYWEKDAIDEEKIIYDVGGKTTVRIHTNCPASKQYTMPAGAYLVNASVPHKVTNLTDDRRIAISLRSKKFRYENPSVVWRDIVEMFSCEIL